MKRYKRLISRRALARLNKIAIRIGRISHSKERTSKWYNRPSINTILNLIGLLLLIFTVCLSNRTYHESQKFGSTTIAQLDTLKKEFMRSPKLKLRVKECTNDTSGRLHIIPEIFNEGDEVASKCGILLMVPSKLDFKSSSFIVSDSMADIQQWSCEYPSYITFRKGKEPLLTRYNRSISFSVKLAPNIKTPLKFICYIAHDKGTDEDTLVIDPSKCH